jgi:hypothetical protein
MVKSNLRDLEVLCNGGILALAKAGVFGKWVTGIADGTALVTTERYADCGEATRTRRLEDTWGKVQEIEVTVYGWKVLLVIDAVTKIPLAVKVGQIQAHEALWTRAVVTQAGVNLRATRACARSSLTRPCWRGPICGGWSSTASSLWCRPKTTWP